MRFLSAIFNSLFGTAQKVTAQIVIAVPTSLSVAYVSQIVMPAAPVDAARIEAPAPAATGDRIQAKVASVVAEPLRAADRKLDFAERDCRAGCDVAAMRVAEATPMEPEFDPAAPETATEVAANDTPPPAPKSAVQATLGRIGATFGILGTPFRSAQVQ